MKNFSFISINALLSNFIVKYRLAPCERNWILLFVNKMTKKAMQMNVLIPLITLFFSEYSDHINTVNSLLDVLWAMLFNDLNVSC